MSTFNVTVHLHNPQRQALPALQIQLWLEKQGQDEQIASGQTDAQGICRLSFDLQLDKHKSAPPFASVYVLVYERNELIYGRPERTVYPVIDATTTIALTLVRPGKVRPIDRIPVRKNELRLKPGETDKLTEVQRKFVNDKLNNTLRTEIQRLYGEADPLLRDAIAALTLDYRAWQDKTLGEVVRDAVLPVLQQNPEIKKLLEEREITTAFTGDKRPVRELLHLDQPLSKNPVFHEETRVIRTSDLVAALELDAELAERLLDQPLNWEQATADQWDELVKTGVLNQEQATTLQRGLAFSRFTGSNPALSAVLHNTAAKARDLARYTLADWQKLVHDHSAGETPNGETPDEYAANLLKVAERSFPATFFLHRVAAKPSAEILQSLSATEALLETNELLFQRGKIVVKNWKGASDETRAALEKQRRLNNTYKYLGLEKILNDKKTRGEAKTKAVREVLGYVETFFQNNPDADFRSSNFLAKTDDSASQLDWTGISAEKQDAVRKQLLAFQRTHSVGGDYATATKLLENGFDSAQSITRRSNARLLAAAGLTSEEAARVKASALKTTLRSSHALRATRDLHWGQYVNLPSDNSLPYDPGAVRGISIGAPEQADDAPARRDGTLPTRTNIGGWNELLELDGYADLFGPLNYCDCDHCRSIFSPAAYFVDLMTFIEDNVWRTNPNTTATDYEDIPDSDPLSLKYRRPDLWTLALTCENTDTLIPYLTIVNEVKEAYIKQEEYDAGLDVWFLLSRFSGIGGNSVTGHGMDYSFHLPFNLPYAESKILLENAGVTLAEVLELSNATEIQQALAWLRCSPQEYEAIAFENTVAVPDRYGYRFNSTSKRVPMTDFLTQTGLKREEVEDVFQLKTILNAGTATIQKETNGPDPYHLEYFEEFVKASLVVFDRIQRFVRLHRLVPDWSRWELDLVLDQLDAATLDNTTIGQFDLGNALIKIGRLRRLQMALKLSVEECVALFTEIPVASPGTLSVRNPLTGKVESKPAPGLFERLFGTGWFAGANQGFHPETDAEIPRVLAGLGIEHADLKILCAFLFRWEPSTDTTPAIELTLTRADLAQIFRHARVAQGLGLSPSNLARLLKLNATEDEILNHLEVFNNLEDILATVRKAGELNELGLSVADCWFVLHGERDIEPDYLYDPLAVIARVQEDTSLYFDQKVFALETGLNEASVKTVLDYLQQNLNLLVVNEKGGFRTSNQMYQTVIWTTFLNHIVNPQIRQEAQNHATEIQAFLIAHHPDAMFVPTIPPVIAEPLAKTFPGVVQEIFGLDSERLTLLEGFMDQYLVNNAYIPALNARLQTVNGEVSVADGTTIKALTILLRRLERTQFLMDKLGFDNTVLAYTQQTLAAFFVLDFDGLQHFASFAAALRLNPAMTTDEVLALISSWDTTTPADSYEPEEQVQLARLLGVSPTLPGTLFNLTNFPLAEFPGSGLLRLNKLAKIAQKLNVQGGDLARLFDLQWPYISNLSVADHADRFAKSLAARDAMSAAFRARYIDLAAYEKAWEPLTDRFNALRRDALCDYLLHRPTAGKPLFKDTGDLYAYLLIDPEMSGCTRTSRLLLATLSCQLYVHRVLMNLEQSNEYAHNTSTTTTFRAVLGRDDHPEMYSTPEDLRQEWEWRKHYRVWEANRKVFLYPENWLEPEWRDDQTPIFKEMKEELLQEKISLEAAEGAYKQYLKKFGEIGNLIIAGVYYENKGSGIYHIFGHTATDPYQYYYRKLTILGRPPENLDTNPQNDISWHSAKEWTPWEKVELSIESPYVSPIIYRNKLYLFWISVTTLEKQKFEDGDSNFDQYAHTINLRYSHQTSNGKWLQPQSIKDFFPGAGDGSDSQLNYFDTSLTKYRVFPYIFEGRLKADYLRDNGASIPPYMGTFWLELFHNMASEDDNDSDRKTWYTDSWTSMEKAVYLNAPRLQNSSPFDAVLGACNFPGTHPTADNERWIRGYYEPWKEELTQHFTYKRLGLNLRVVFNDPGAFVFRYDQNQFLIRSTFEKEQSCVWNLDVDSIYVKGYRDTKREMLKLNTSTAENLIDRFALGGLEGFLSLETQRITEDTVPISFTKPHLLLGPFRELEKLYFEGAYGGYFRELFLHIPLAVADHLNSEGKFKEADWWFRRVFDPTAPPESELDNPADRYWRYIEFRDQKLPKLVDILTDDAAIEKYRRDPFNPHAIARLRISAYQKYSVLAYVDNLIDWGDSLFTKDTQEDNNEAMQLYMLAQDILGERPAKSGKCETAPDSQLTYAQISASTGTVDSSEFLVLLENWVEWHATQVALPAENTGFESLRTERGGDGPTSQTEGLESYEVLTTGIGTGIQADQNLNLTGVQADLDLYALEGSMVVDGWRPAFCVPFNEKILEYWDRVADRLYKLRNCMNISGVKRQLALFQPPIDPALLVAARAAGLDLEDILASLDAPVPPYRFSYLIEKAKSFAGTVQSFGGGLLSAMEKRDAEELLLLRDVHERNLLKMTREVKKQAIQEAQANLQASVEGMTNVMNRVTQYALWIEENLNGWERTQQVATHTASILNGVEAVFGTMSSLLSLLPQVGAPTAMTYGGMQVSRNLYYAGNSINSLAKVASLLASSAGLEASFQRRKQDWEFQKKTAEQEIKQVQQQIAAASIRLAIAEKDLAIHEKQMEQAEELHEFYTTKFSGLGLYKYLSSSLGKLHRQAYNLALDMARQAEVALNFERDDVPKKHDFSNLWDTNYAGLLSGEKLLFQLQQMEKSYLDTHVRRLEITQTFSLFQLDPAALLMLRANGVCTFELPEWAFDLQYPGHYCRKIKSVRLTIPCVVGPYVNVPAMLTLTDSMIRQEPDVNADLLGGPRYAHTTVAASTANNDGGQFELNFRDERYLPFEYGGAVKSQWTLELPANYKPFDYNTISDVLVHLSYMAKFDGGLFKTGVLGDLSGEIGTLKRLISLRDEFPDAWYQLESGAVSVDIKVTTAHFPQFTSGKLKIDTNTAVQAINIASSVVSIVPAPDCTVSGTDWLITAKPSHKTTLNGKTDVLLMIAYSIDPI